MQLEAHRKRLPVAEIPAAEWEHKSGVARVRTIATAPVSAGVIAKEVEYSLRSVQYSLSYLFDAGVIARRKAGKLFQYALAMEYWDKVEKPEDDESPITVEASGDNDEDESDEEDDQAAAEPIRFCGTGSQVRLEKPIRVSSITFDARIACEFVGGELRATVRSEGEVKANDLRNGLHVAPESSSEAKANVSRNPLRDKVCNTLTTNGNASYKMQTPSTLTSFSFLPALGPEAAAASEAVAALQKRVGGKALAFDVRVSGDYVQVAITPLGLAYDFKAWDEVVQGLAVDYWGEGVNPVVVTSIARKCVSLKRGPGDFASYVKKKATRKTKRNPDALKGDGQSPGLLDFWADDAIRDWAEDDAKNAAIVASVEQAKEQGERESLAHAQEIASRWATADPIERELVTTFFPHLAPAVAGA